MAEERQQDAQDYVSWDPPLNSFSFKAQQNLQFAEEARKQSRFDIEASRIYFALHQLACELVRGGKMTVQKPGKRATKAQPWRIGHGSYLAEVEAILGIDHAGTVFSVWHQFRTRADYEPGLIQNHAHWKKAIKHRREQALRLAEAIYEKLK